MDAENRAERLQGYVIEVLRDALGPLRANAIRIRIEQARSYPCNTSEINKILYKGPFDKVGSEGAAPVWKLRADNVRVSFLTWTPGLTATRVDGVGVFYFDPGLSDDNLMAALRAISACVPGDGGILHHDSSDGGKRIAALADVCGFAEARELD